MKKAFSDVKSYVTILFATSLVVLMFIAVFKSESIFDTVFLLFTNLCTAVFTYYFTRRKNEIENNVESGGGTDV